MGSNTYTPPGVSVSEVISPSIPSPIDTPSLLCLVGMAEGGIQVVDFVTLTGTTAVVLPSMVGKDDATLTVDMIESVTDASDTSVVDPYVENTDWDFEHGGDPAHSIRRSDTTTIPSGHTVKVTYTYIPADYYQPILLSNLGDVEDRFGSAYTDDGSAINSILSYGAAVAFENGAVDIFCLALGVDSGDGTLVQPEASDAANESVWRDNFARLQGFENVGVIVPLVGQSASGVGDTQELQIFEALQDHIKFMLDSEQQYVMGILGEDSSTDSTLAAMGTLRSHATTLAARRSDIAEYLVMVSPSRFTRLLPTGTNQLQVVGGQYVAAGIGGMLVSQSASNSLTRKFLTGFATVAETRTKSDKNTDSANGLLVLEQKGTQIQIRHGLTLDTSSVTKREINVVRAKQRVVEVVRETLETEVIGSVIADGDAPTIVNSVVIGALDLVQGDGDIVSYSTPQSRTLSLDPTAIEVRFSYLPAFAVNYVSIVFSLDLAQGSVLPSTSNEDNSTF